MINQKNISRFIGIIILGLGGLIGAFELTSERPSCACLPLTPSSAGWNYLRSMNQFQTRYFWDHDTFAMTLDQLELYDPSMEKYHKYYSFSIAPSPKGVVHYAVPKTHYSKNFGPFVWNVNLDKQEMYSYVTRIVQLNKDGKINSITCQSNTPTTDRVAAPVFENGKLSCGINSYEQRDMKYMY